MLLPARIHRLRTALDCLTPAGNYFFRTAPMIGGLHQLSPATDERFTRGGPVRAALPVRPATRASVSVCAGWMERN